MPVLMPRLVIGLSELLDSEFPGYVGTTDDVSEAAKRWSKRFNDYAKDMTYTPSMTELAIQDFETNFKLLSSESKNGLIQLPLAFHAYAIKFSSGISSGVSTPPAIPPIITPSTLIFMAGGSIQEVISTLALEIDLWFKTGTVIINGATIPWN